LNNGSHLHLEKNKLNVSKTIRDHIKYCLTIESIDELFTYKLLLLYYYAIVIVIVNLFLVMLIKFKPMSHIYGSTFVNIGIILAVIVAITLVSLISSVSKSEHLPYNPLYSLFIRKL
jgi:hypothetical protein